MRQGFGGEGEAGNDDEGEDDEQPKIAAMSDRLAQRLSAHRTAALQIEVARHPQAALAAVVHGMVQTILQGSHYGHDLPLGVSLKVQDRLEGMAPDWPESPAAVALRELQQVAGEALPEDSAELFAALLAKPQDELVRLLAVCVASTVDVVTPRATVQQPGEELAQAVGLDMAAWWKPTAEGYFKVSVHSTTYWTYFTSRRGLSNSGETLYCFVPFSARTITLLRLILVTIPIVKPVRLSKVTFSPTCSRLSACRFS